MGTPQSLAARLVPASFPHPVARLELRETATSWLVLTGPYVYKIKKPVHFDFLDASSLERRRFLCEEELRLNRRFAPDLYLAVAPIGETRGLPTVVPTSDAVEPIVEYAVQMRQFAKDDELAQRLGAQGVACSDMDRFGARLADWHGAASEARDGPYGSLALVRSQVLDNFPSLREAADAEEIRRLAELEQWCREELDRLSDLIDARRRSGYVRECHGDLHAGNVVHWQGEWLPFDCLEFEPRLRWIDVCSDVAFLLMDLAARGHAGLGYAFLSAYLERAGDYESLALLRLFAVYRALVRAKVDSLAGSPERRRERIATAEAHSKPRVPALILMHGLSGSGKSWLSTRLIPALQAIRVRSDVERRRLLGPGAHSGAADDATDRRLWECADRALAAGMRVIVDATFLEASRRAPFRQLAQRWGCPLLLIDCRAPTEVLESRIAERARAARDPSEADAAVLRTQLAAARALQGTEAADALSVDTSAPNALEQAIAAAHRRLPA